MADSFLTDHHYSIRELAQLWNVSPTWVRRRFRYEEGVVRLGRVWRIPQTVAERVHRLSQVPTSPYRLPKLVARRMKDGSIGLFPRPRKSR